MLFLNSRCKSKSGNGGGAAVLPTSTQSVVFDRGLTQYAAKASPTAAISSGITTALSVSMWIKTTEAGGATVYPLVGQYDVNTSNAKWWLGLQGATLSTGRLRFVTSNNGTSAAVFDQTTGVTVNDGAWQHVAATYNGSGNVVMYVNGANVYSAAATHASLFNSTFDFRIASVIGGGGTNLTWNGSADEVALFDVELNATEITELYNGGVTFDIETHSRNADLVGYWHMGDGDTYPTLLDQKSANDLTMVNMVAGDIVTDAP